MAQLTKDVCQMIAKRMLNFSVHFNKDSQIECELGGTTLTFNKGQSDAEVFEEIVIAWLAIKEYMFLEVETKMQQFLTLNKHNFN